MSDRQERWRVAAVRTCELFFLLILLEGVLRKWTLNSLQQPLALIRDPVLAAIYFEYLVYKGWRLPIWSLLFALAFSLFAFVILIQETYLDLSFKVYLIGLRNYLAYIPLSFVMYDIYERQDVNRFLRIFLFTTIPVAILAVAQFYSPLDSILNKQLDDSVEGIFQVVAGVVRPYGPFTFVLGQATYAVMALAVGFIALERRREISFPLPLFLACLAAIGSMGVVSGTRTYFLSAGLIFVSFALSAVTSGDPAPAVRRGLYAALSLIGLVVLMTVVFPQSFATMTERQADAVEGEGSTLARALFMGTEMFSVIGDTPLFGHGIGFGTNAGAFAATGAVTFTLAEYEWTRIILECGPLLGLLVIIARVLLTMWVGVLAVRANMRRGDAAPLILFGFVAPLIFYAQISGQNTMLSFAWFSLGLLLASIRTAAKASSLSIAPQGRPVELSPTGRTVA